mgnify:CR=1 FL=1
MVIFIFFFFFFPNNLKAIRKSKGLTQKQLSELSGVSRVAIARYETNQQTPQKAAVEKLARALDVSVEELTNEPPTAKALETPPTQQNKDTKPITLSVNLDKVYKDIEEKMWGEITAALLNDKDFKADIMDVIAKHLAKKLNDNAQTDDTKK